MSIQIAPIKQNNTINFKGNAQQNQTNVNLTPKQKADEFISKHKKQIAIGAGIAATIGAVAGVVALVMKGKNTPVASGKVQEAAINAVESVDYEKIKSQLWNITSEFNEKKSAVQILATGSTGLLNLRKFIREYAENNKQHIQFINSFQIKGKQLEKTLQEADSLLVQYDKLSEKCSDPKVVKYRPVMECREMYDELVAQAKELRLAYKFDEKGNLKELPSIEVIKKIFSNTQ